MTPFDISSIRHYHRINSSLHTAGQPNATQLSQLSAAGIRSVINLAMPDSDYAEPEEADLLARQAIDYCPIPIPFDAPTMAHFERFKLALDRAERPTLIHCALNWRVSAFMFAYRVRQGDNEATAREDLHAIWQPTGTWAALLEEICRHAASNQDVSAS
ncbi:MAG TPA: protein tyrosine phosphatase family protein [Pseudomonadales bacterium]|nr:protein tyrosine phosphatase family protein [Pseudomonadales bacterium]